MIDQEQETARLVPTETGWWWYGMWPHAPVEVVLRLDDGRLWCGGPVVGFPVTDDGGWLAPIPDPATCAAWVAAGRTGPEVLRALADWADLDSLVEGDHGASVDLPALRRLMRRRRDALSEVIAAMRAARAARAGAEGGSE